MPSIDGATGKVTDESRHACSRATTRPSISARRFTGGKNWMPGAYSPKTGLMYMPLENLCSVVTSAGPKTARASSACDRLHRETGAGRDQCRPGAGNLGEDGCTAWNYNQRAGDDGARRDRRRPRLRR